jgi:CBS domain-containing protein
MSLTVSCILNAKGREVATIAPEASIAVAADMLAQQNLGALVVSSDGRRVQGIVSERDLVARLAARGAACLEGTVAELMNSDVTSCMPGSTCDELMRSMTQGRFRHVPVLVDGELAGIISIGDVVKARLDELEVQAEALEQYVTGSLA